MKQAFRRSLARRIVLDAMRQYAKTRRQFRCEPFDNAFVAGDRGHVLGLIRMGHMTDVFSQGDRLRMEARVARIGRLAINHDRRPRLARAA